MNERLEKLENELASMRPAKFPRALEHRIVNAITARPSPKWADRVLLSSVVMGAAAACIIVSVLLGDTAGVMKPSTDLPLARANPSAVYPLLLTRAETTDLDQLK
jgi:hypothetical protein